MNRKNIISKVLITLLLTAIVIYAWTNYNLNPTYKFGQKLMTSTVLLFITMAKLAPLKEET